MEANSQVQNLRVMLTLYARVEHPAMREYWVISKQSAFACRCKHSIVTVSIHTTSGSANLAWAPNSE